MRQQISRLAVGLFFALCALQSLAAGSDKYQTYRKYLQTTEYSDVAMAMDANGLWGYWAAMTAHKAKHDILTRCREKSKRPETCKIVDVNGLSAWWRGGAKGNPVSSSTSTVSTSSSSASSSSGYAGMVWCARASGVTKELKQSCRSNGGDWYHLDFRDAADAAYRRLKSSSSSSALPSSYNPENWCVRSSGVTKERFQRCVVSGGLAYSKRSDAKNIWRHQFGSTTTASLTLRSNVRGDRVYIDGKYKGSTGLDLDLPKGRHTIRIEKEGYKPYEKRIDLDRALTLRASLEKIDKNPIETLLETNQCPGCDLAGADLTEADLTGADLTGTDLTGADLTGVNLQNAKLAGADLRNAKLMNANFHMARFCNTIMPDGSKENSDC